MYNIYQEAGIGGTIFIKISNTYGLRIGSFQHSLSLKNDDPLPEWRPAESGNKNNSFSLFREKEQNTNFTEAKPVKDELIKKHKIDKFIEGEVMQLCMKLAICGGRLEA